MIGYLLYVLVVKIYFEEELLEGDLVYFLRDFIYEMLLNFGVGIMKDDELNFFLMLEFLVKDERVFEELIGEKDNFVNRSSFFLFFEGLGVFINKVCILMVSDILNNVFL